MAVGNEHKKNLRPYILLFCFFWGLVLGFVSYLYMKTAAQRLEIIEVKEEREVQKKKQEIEKEKTKVTQIDPFKTTEEIEKPPEVADVLSKPEVKLIDDKIIAPNFRQPPIIPNPTIEDMPGLNGQTVVKPFKPKPVKVEVISNPVQRNSSLPAVKKRSPFSDNNVVLDDVAPPELDD